MKTILSLFLLMFSILSLFIIHPLNLGIIILIQTLLMCMITGMLIKSYWFSYILFLTFMGGLLVLFMYVASIASNELMKLSGNIVSISMFWMMSLLMSLIIMKEFKLLTFYSNSDMINFSQMWMINNENKINLAELYNTQTMYLTILMIIYLFITLLAVVKITNIFYGPLRIKN